MGIIGKLWTEWFWMKWDGYLDGYFWIIKDAQIPYIYIYIYIYRYRKREREREEREYRERLYGQER